MYNFSMINGTFSTLRTTIVGWDSSVGIGTPYGLDGLGIESRWGLRFSASVETGRGSHPASYTIGTGSLLWIKTPGCGVIHPSHPATKLKKEYSYTSFPLLCLRGKL
jgi:hypothetical protein